MKACKEVGLQFAFQDQDHTTMYKMESLKKASNIKALGDINLLSRQ